jgi:hypothetical protein
LAAVAGVPPDKINRVLHGQQDLDGVVLVRLSEALSFDPKTLYSPIFVDPARDRTRERTELIAETTEKRETREETVQEAQEENGANH